MNEAKRLFLAFFLSLLLLYLYNLYLVKKHPEKFKPPETVKKEEIRASEPQEVVIKGEEPEVEEIPFETPLLNIYFSPLGGRIVRARIKKYGIEITSPGGFFGTKMVKGSKIYDTSQLPFQMKVEDIPSGKRVIFFYKTDTLSFEKIYTFTDTSYSFALELPGAGRTYLEIFSYATTETVPDLSRHRGGIIFLGGKVVLNLVGARIKKRKVSYPGAVEWGGVKSKYFAVLSVPETVGEEGIFERVGNDVKTIIVSPSSKFTCYLGPLEYHTLKRVYPTLDNAIHFGYNWVRPISKLIFHYLVFLHRFIPNYGVVIILFALTIVVILTPLNLLSFRSMKKMRKIQKKMEELKKKYKKDPKRLHQEIMALYQKEGVNPFSGCFPMFIQFPIFFAMYAVLSSSIELWKAPFFGWINDLSQRDPFFVLPILMGATMLIQQRFFSPQGANPEQRMMSYLTPIIFTIFFATFPAGLVLYWFVYNLLMIGIQAFIQKPTGGEHEDFNGGRKNKRRGTEKGA